MLNESRYARPIADALAADPQFRSWFLGKTEFARVRDTATPLHEEQKRARSQSAKNWWGSYWVTNSYPFWDECGERETDLLAVFQGGPGFRFALHVEVKAPGDRFREGQARDYARRARCWAGPGRNPKTVLQHDKAATVLCCEARFLREHAAECSHFSCRITFEEIAKRLGDFPDPA